MKDNTGLTFTQPVNNIFFCVNDGEELLRLDSQGMVYKGQRVDDAGEAHRAFMEVMNAMKGVK